MTVIQRDILEGVSMPYAKTPLTVKLGGFLFGVAISYSGAEYCCNISLY